MPKIIFSFVSILLFYLPLVCSGFRFLQDPGNVQYPCKRWNTEKTQCEQCGEKLYWDQVNKRCQRVPLHCQMWNGTTGECQLCLQNYGNGQFVGPINGRCPPYKKPYERQLAKCITKGDYGGCDKCEPNSYYDPYYDPPSDSCRRATLNCARLDEEDGSCIKCKDTYGDEKNNNAPVDGNCPTFQEFLANQGGQCLEWNSDRSLCLECEWHTYFDPIRKNCLGVTLNCETWNKSTGECQTCLTGFGDDPQKGKPIKQQCPLYDPYAQPQPQALPELHEIPNCLTYNSQNQCTECETGYGDANNQAINGNCDIQERSATGTIAHCVAYNQWTTEEECIGCQRGYGDSNNMPIQNKCPPQDLVTFKKVKNCQTWSTRTGDCLICKTNFGNSSTMGKPINGQCPPYRRPAPPNLKPVKNCQTWSTRTGDCLICKTNFGNSSTMGKPINGQCPPYKPPVRRQKVPQNCQNWNKTTFQCIECYEGYGDHPYSGKPLNGECPYYFKWNQNGPYNCAQWSQINGQCFKCMQGYGDSLYFGNPINGKCPPYYRAIIGSVGSVSITEHCKDSDPETGQCSLCEPGYGDDPQYGNPIRGKCPPYKSAELQVTEMCQTWNPSTFQCITCQVGYGDDPSYGKPINQKCPVYEYPDESAAVNYGGLSAENLQSIETLRSLW